MKIKPILQVTRCDDDVRRLQTELDARTVQLQEIQREREETHQDVQTLVQQLEATRAVGSSGCPLMSGTVFVELR